MKHLSKRGFLATGMAGLAALVASGPARASGDEHVVEMLNKSPDGNERQVFHPPVLKVAPGDTVRFAATDRGHNSASNSDMMPEGAEEWTGKINEEVEITFDVPGVYGYHCVPHRSAGMVGLILVGDVTEDQLAAAEGARQRGKARQRYEAYFEEARALS
ncbi:MAG: pseudoazurin [Silicimonas sp.]|nr:pseudoazurin [Silicimonas sp.]NND18080.1 pseudoazurin [Silicimonas sp.]NND22659.1 pseudoazurin [Silicimonas sp.]NNF91087.1 pseudoazurin [Boseongicola sp.]NNL72338.1 pseudoazurin [Silicimonas sp.]